MKAFEVFTIGVFAASALARLQIILPNSHTEWEAGKPGTIKWKAIDGGVTGRLSIELMEGSDPANMQAVTTIAENIPATGMETHWNVPKSFKNSNNYSIKIVDENGEEYYGQYFKGAGGKTDMGKKAGKQQQGRSAKGDDKAKSSEAAASNKQQQQQQQPQQQGKMRSSQGMKSSAAADDNKDSNANEGVGNAPSGSVVTGACAMAIAACVLAAMH